MYRESSSESSSSSPYPFWDPILFSTETPIKAPPPPPPPPTYKKPSIDLSRLFDLYNSIMSSITDGLLSMVEKYKVLNDVIDAINANESARKFDSPRKIVSDIRPFLPIKLHGRMFEENASTADVVAILNSNAIRYNKLFNDIIKTNGEFGKYNI